MFPVLPRVVVRPSSEASSRATRAGRPTRSLASRHLHASRDGRTARFTCEAVPPHRRRRTRVPLPTARHAWRPPPHQGLRPARLPGRAPLDREGALRPPPRLLRDEATAIAAGYRPCAVCMPHEYRAWKANQASCQLTLRGAAGRIGSCDRVAPVAPGGSRARGRGARAPLVRRRRRDRRRRARPVRLTLAGRRRPGPARLPRGAGAQRAGRRGGTPALRRPRRARARAAADGRRARRARAPIQARRGRRAAAPTERLARPPLPRPPRAGPRQGEGGLLRGGGADAHAGAGRGDAAGGRT